MRSEKKRAPWVPALIRPPGPYSTLADWIEYHADLDGLEAEIRISHPDLDDVIWWRQTLRLGWRRLFRWRVFGWQQFMRPILPTPRRPAD